MTQTEALRMALRSIRELIVDESDDAPALQGVRMRKLTAEKAIKEALAQQPAQQQDNPHPEYCKGYAAGLEAGAICEKKPTQPEQELSGLPMVISGAIYDFAGYLTTRDKVIEVGSTANASPIADLVKAWAELRGLSLDNAAVLSWQEWLANVPASDTSQYRVDETAKQRHDYTCPTCEYHKNRAARWRAEAYKQAGHDVIELPWVGLTDEEIRDVGQLTVEGERMLPYSFARAIETKLKEKNT